MLTADKDKAKAEAKRSATAVVQKRRNAERLAKLKEEVEKKGYELPNNPSIELLEEILTQDKKK